MVKVREGGGEGLENRVAGKRAGVPTRFMGACVDERVRNWVKVTRGAGEWAEVTD